VEGVEVGLVVKAAWAARLAWQAASSGAECVVSIFPDPGTQDVIADSKVGAVSMDMHDRCFGALAEPSDERARLQRSENR
jgi:hypothetical protein